MGLYAAGTTSFFNPYKFSVYRTTAFSSSGYALMSMDTKLFDTGNNYNTSSGLFTAPVSGFYYFHGFAGIISLAGGNAIGAGIYIVSSIGGGPRNDYQIQLVQGATGGFGAAANASGLYQLNAGDNAGFMIYTSNSNTSSGITNNGFNGFLLSLT
jgi:hypothetical protein